MTEQKEPTTAEKLTDAINATKGAVKMKWADEVWKESGHKVRVLQLSMEASVLFQIRALDAAVKAAARRPSGSSIGMNTADFFHIHQPTDREPMGHLSIRVGDVHDSVLFPYIQRAIYALKLEKENADQSNIENVEKAALSAFGDNIESCRTQGRRRSERLELIVSCTKVSDFEKCSQAILSKVTHELRDAIPGNRANVMDLQTNIRTQENGIAISFNPAYTKEFTEACLSLEGKLSPSLIKKQPTP